MSRNFWRPALFSPIHCFTGKLTRLNFGEDFLHLLARLGIDDARAAGVIAVFGCVGNRETHVAEAAFIDEVDDQLELVQTFEVGDLGRVARIDERLETGADQLGSAAAEHGLLAEQIAFGLFAEGGFDDTGAQTAERRGIGKGVFESLAARILLDGDEGGNAGAFDEDFAHAMAGGFGGDHGDVDIGGRFDEAEVDVEAVGEHQGFAFGEVRRDVGGVEIALDVIGYEHHHHVGGFGGLGGR